MRRVLLIVCLMMLCAAPSTNAQTAQSAASFTAGVGVNTHLGYSETVYWKQWPMVRDRLRELGVSHIRDGTFPAEYPDVIGPTVAARYRELGLGLNLLVGHEQAMVGRTTLQQRLDWIKANGLTEQTIGIEGSNEYDADITMDWTDDAAKIESLRAMQCDIWNRVKGDPALASKMVVGPSGGLPFYEDRWHFHIAYNRGDLTHCLDRGNLHPYPGAKPPHLHQGRDLDYAKIWGSHVYGDKPDWITENGYWNQGENNAISEWAGGVYVPRMMMEMFRRGFERTQLYELVDLNTGAAGMIHNGGLIRSDGTRKPAFTVLANTMAVLKDNAPASGSLDYTVTCRSNCHSPIRRVLLRHSSGAYFIALWSETDVAGGATAAQNVDVTLAQRAARMDVISPASGTAPLKSQTNALKINTHVTDYVRLIKVTGAP